MDESLGLPKPNGATDYADSSHMAGTLAIIEHPLAPDLREYYRNGLYVRHPNEKRYDFSRDQAWLLMVGLLKQGHNDYVNTDFINGKDIKYPSLMGLNRIAKGKKPFFYQRWWAIVEVYIHAKWQPLEEPLQTSAACEAYGLYSFWKRHNKLWKWSIYRYWSQLDGAWRNEPELAIDSINYIETKGG